MSAEALLTTWTAPARQRQRVRDALLFAPPGLCLCALAGRIGGGIAALALLAAGLGLGGWLIRRRAARFSRTWLIRTLDGRRPELEDSTALLFADPATLTPLQRLQRARIAQRLQAGTPEDLALAWRPKSLLWLWGGALGLIALIVLWPHPGERPVILSPSKEQVPAVPGVPRLIAQNLRIVPPAYTGLPLRDEPRLDARIPAGSRLEWTLRFAPEPAQPRLAVVAGPALALRPEVRNWTAARVVGAPFLYRVDPAHPGTQLPPLHRIDVIADAQPQVRVIRPSASLTLVTPGQRSWSPVFEAVDDYGVAGQGRLRITLAIGEGENVTFSEREIAVAGSGPPRQRRFAPVLDFAQLGFAAGGDLVVQLIARDNRAPAPQTTRGPAIVLRWPSPKAPESGGLQGLVSTTLPAYFRSQRQIILDAEALLKQRRALPADRFAMRSRSIGDDQQILRGRYSQFLGGEEEGEPQSPDGDDHDDHGAGSGLPTRERPGFGAPEDVLAEFGHPHDDPAAASLDPQTRAVLQQAVNEMWQSELQLKQGRPDQALPFANRALRFIKQVQQATRIFLSRVGPELPPIDPARRMTGKREGLASRALPIVPVDSGDGVVAATWRALGEGSDSRPVDLGGLDRWLSVNRDRLPDPLSLAAAIEAVRTDPACRSCRAGLRAQLWLALERPPAGVAPRVRSDAAGERYLRLLGEGAR